MAPPRALRWGDPDSSPEAGVGLGGRCSSHVVLRPEHPPPPRHPCWRSVQPGPSLLFSSSAFTQWMGTHVCLWAERAEDRAGLRQGDVRTLSPNERR